MTLILTVVTTIGTLLTLYCAGIMAGLAVDRPDITDGANLVLLLSLIVAAVGTVSAGLFHHLEKESQQKALSRLAGTEGTETDKKPLIWDRQGLHRGREDHE
jgi:hypothetical protein